MLLSFSLMSFAAESKINKKSNKIFWQAVKK